MHESRSTASRLAAIGLLACALAATAVTSASARAIRGPSHVVRLTPAPEKDAALVMDGASGQILYERNPDATRYPASLTKMMTLYLLFESLEKGRLSLDTPLNTSLRAAAQSPTKLGLAPGKTISVETAIKAITVLSANDVAVVVAEALGGGNEAFFASVMTEKARELGMMRTNFHNASGLPDPRQQTTARDMATLGRSLAYDFPRYFHYFSTPSFSFNGRVYNSHDNLLETFEGTDGIKTGYTRASGFNLVSSVVRYNKHVIGVVLGGASESSRDIEMTRILAAAFDYAKMNPTLLAEANAPWYGGKGPSADVVNSGHLRATNVLTAMLDAPAPTPVPAPVLVASVAKPAADPVIPIPAPKPMLVASLTPQLRASTAVAQIEQGDVAGTSMAVPLSVRKPSLAPAKPSLVMAKLPFALPKPPIASISTWAVQIGAFATQALAEAQLTTYAKRAKNVVGSGKHVVTPFAAVDGKTLYRARFGGYAEDQAREVCKRMTAQGQSCFASKTS